MLSLLTTETPHRLGYHGADLSSGKNYACKQRDYGRILTLENRGDATLIPGWPYTLFSIFKYRANLMNLTEFLKGKLT